MSIIIKRYLQDNWENIIYQVFCIIYIFLTIKIWNTDNTISIKIISCCVILGVIAILLILCYYNESGFKITISIKDLIKLNINKKYQYQKLIKERKYKYTRYIKYIDKDIQLEIFNEISINKLKLDSYYNFNYLKDLINPCYEIIQKIVQKNPNYFNYINKKCNNYNEYKELYKFMTI
jgi:hypothetical protein